MTVVSCNFWQIPPNWFESALAIQSCLPACRPFRLSQRVGACTSAGRRYSGAQFSFGSFSRININYERAGSRKAGLLQEKRTTTLHNVRNSPSSGSIHKSLNHHIIHFQLRVQQLPYQTRFLCPAVVWRDERMSHCGPLCAVAAQAPKTVSCWIVLLRHSLDKGNHTRLKSISPSRSFLNRSMIKPLEAAVRGSRDQLRILIEDFFTYGLDVGRRHRIYTETANMYSAANLEEPLRFRREGCATCSPSRRSPCSLGEK